MALSSGTLSPDSPSSPRANPTHHLSSCLLLLRLWFSSPMRSSTAPAACCSKALPSPPTLSLQRGVMRAAPTQAGMGQQQEPPQTYPRSLSKSLGRYGM